jgi:hypothetical protein
MILINPRHRSALTTVRGLLAKASKRPIRTLRPHRIVQLIDLRSRMYKAHGTERQSRHAVDENHWHRRACR